MKEPSSISRKSKSDIRSISLRKVAPPEAAKAADKGLEALAEYNYLTKLDLSYCRGLTNVSALAGCKALHTLNLRGCLGVTDVSVSNLSTKKV